MYFPSHYAMHTVRCVCRHAVRLGTGLMFTLWPCESAFWLACVHEAVGWSMHWVDVICLADCKYSWSEVTHPWRASVWVGHIRVEVESIGG